MVQQLVSALSILEQDVTAVILHNPLMVLIMELNVLVKYLVKTMVLRTTVIDGLLMVSVVLMLESMVVSLMYKNYFIYTNQTTIDILPQLVNKMLTKIPHYQVIVGDTGLVLFTAQEHTIGIDHQI